MRIGLISDTHIPEAARELPAEVYRALEGVDLILHAGDMHVIDVLDWLEQVAPVVAARGNGDGSQGRPPLPETDPRVKDTHVLHLGGLRVGLTHGFPLPWEITWTSFEELMQRKFGCAVHVIVCGDTHVAQIASYGNVLMVNPGSPTLPHNLTGYPGTIGLLNIKDGVARAQVVQLR